MLMQMNTKFTKVTKQSLACEVNTQLCHDVGFTNYHLH